MDAVVAGQLVALNRRFYSDFGGPFSATRGRVQPGVRRILASLTGTERILDLGCGNGWLTRILAERGHRGSYLGLDFSLPLLADAKSQPGRFSAVFRQVDLTSLDWERQDGSFSLPAFHFDLIFAFAALHHIPGHELRRDILRKARGLLAQGGRFIHSEWQFMNSEKLRARILPWERAGLSASQVDKGDTLLDWRAGGNGLRYVHHFSTQELDALASESGFRVVASFSSDGDAGNLALYQIWEGS